MGIVLQDSDRVGDYAMGGAREARTGRNRRGPGAESAMSRRIEKTTTAATKNQRGVRTAEKRPGVPGVSAAATTNARQSNATSLRAWII